MKNIEVTFSSVPGGMKNVQTGERFEILSMPNGQLRVLKLGCINPVEFWFQFNQATGRYDPVAHAEC